MCDQFLVDHFASTFECEPCFECIRLRSTQCRVCLTTSRLLLDIGETHDHVADLDVVIHIERQFGDAAAGLCRQRGLVDGIDDTVPQTFLRR